MKKIDMKVEVEKIKENQNNLLVTLVDESKNYDGTYNGAVKYLAKKREEYLFKNDQEVLAYFNKASAFLDNELAERVNFLKDKNIY